MNIVTVLGSARQLGNLPSLSLVQAGHLDCKVYCIAKRSLEQDLDAFVSTIPNGHSVRVISTHPALQLTHRFHRNVEHERITDAGTQRNRALVALAGESFVSLDDDAQPAFLDSATFLDSIPPAIAEPSDRASGKTTFSSSPVSSSKEYNQEQVRTDALRCLEELNGAVEQGSGFSDPVRLAFCGIVGNRWYSRASTGYFARSPLREQAYRSRKLYAQSARSGMAMICVPQRDRSASPFFITCCCAINAHELMPPFPPLGRSEDAVFGLLVQYMYPDNLIAHLPFMVQHDLGPSKPFTQADFQEIGLDFGTMNRLVIQHLIETALPVEGEAALRHMGERLVEVSHISHADWLNLTHELYLRNAAGEVRQLEELLERYNEKPSYWAKDVHDYIDLVTRRGPDIANIHPQELRQTHSLAEAGVFQRSFLGSYGELMMEWPDIWQAALELKESGWTAG